MNVEDIKNKLKKNVLSLEKVLNSKDFEIKGICYNFETNVPFKIKNNELLFDSFIENLSDDDISNLFEINYPEFEIVMVNNLSASYFPRDILEAIEDYVNDVLIKNVFKNQMKI